MSGNGKLPEPGAAGGAAGTSTLRRVRFGVTALTPGVAASLAACRPVSRTATPLSA